MSLPTIDCNGTNFILHLPDSNRTLEVPANGNGCKLLKKVITEAKRSFGEAQPKGYIRDYPTQHVMDIWLKEDKLRKEEEAKAKAKEEREQREAEFKEMGIDLSNIRITL